MAPPTPPGYWPCVTLRREGIWDVRIKFGALDQFIGTFDSFRDAVEAERSTRRVLGLPPSKRQAAILATLPEGVDLVAHLLAQQTRHRQERAREARNDGSDQNDQEYQRGQTDA